MLLLLAGGAAPAATAPPKSSTAGAAATPVLLPQSSGARFVTVAPAGGAAVYGTGTGAKVLLSRPPYRSAVSVRLPPAATG